MATHRVQQHDWQRPLRGDWSIQLQEAVLESEREVVLVAHSLGCILTAWWAVHSPLAKTRVKAALLVAPGDVEQADLRNVLPGWSPVLLQRLPFAACAGGQPKRPVLQLVACAAAGRMHGARAWSMRGLSAISIPTAGWATGMPAMPCCNN